MFRQPGDEQIYGEAARGHFDTISIAVHNAVDSRIPASEQLEKRRGCFGFWKFLAKRRNTLVCSIAIFLTVTALVGLAFILVFITIGVGTTAGGVVYNGPQRMPWHRAEEHRERQLEHMGDTVELSGGALVERVVQPQEQMDSVDQVLLLLNELHSNALVGGIQNVTREDVSRGYLPWRPFEHAPRANFTLEHMRKLMRTHHPLESGDTCVCYKSYMVPFDIVYLVADDEVLYEPQIVSESSETRRFKRECRAHKLLRLARREPGWADDQYYETALSGRVSYITERAMFKRRQIEAPQFPCIKHCLTIFDGPLSSPAVGDGTEIEPLNSVADQ